MTQIVEFLTQHKYILILALVIAILLFPVSLPFGAGDWDLQAYWSSTYLLAHGQDFSNPQALGKIEHTLTTRRDPTILYSWFSPIGNVVLLPFTFIPFSRAVYYWLVLNIAILFCVAVLIWENTDTRIWIPLLTVFGFSMTVFSLVFGQINLLEVLGLALFVSLSKNNRPYFAGASLVLTTIKPHLVILTLPVLFFDLVRKKEWRPLVGFFVTLVFCFVVLFAFYPLWIQSFFEIVRSGMGTVRETPTVNGLLVLVGEYRLGKLIWAIALLTGIVWWLKDGKNWDRCTFIDLSVTVGLIVAPIGWSYDQIMLLFPILRLLSWATTGRLPVKTSKIIVVSLISGNVFSWLLRILIPSDVWFFWVPLLILALYLIAKKQFRNL
jgi:hypothetical protein